MGRHSNHSVPQQIDRFADEVLMPEASMDDILRNSLGPRPSAIFSIIHEHQQRSACVPHGDSLSQSPSLDSHKLHVG